MERDVISKDSKGFLEFIDELKKASTLNSPTLEISRMYVEIANILSEAFDEYNPQDLPNYQRRLEAVAKLQKSEESLNDPLFVEDLKKAEQLLNKLVKQRYTTFEKLSNLADSAIRILGGSSSFASDFARMGSDAADAGRRAGEAFNAVRNSFKFTRSKKISSEEERVLHDTLKGNNQSSPRQYGQSGTESAFGGTKSLIKTVPVIDDQLIRTANVQTKLLTQIYENTKETSTDIRKIKNLLESQFKSSDDTSDQSALNNLEREQEANSSATQADVKSSNGPLSDMLKAAGYSQEKKEDQSQEGNTGAGGVLEAIGAVATIKTVGGALKKGIKKMGPMVKKILPFARKAVPRVASTLGAVFASPAAQIVAAGVTGYEAGGLINDYVVDPLMKQVTPLVSGTGQSVSASVGEKIKGIDYYKNLFSQKNLDYQDQQKAEKWALQFLRKAAKEKQQLYKEAFKDGTVYGNGSYVIGDKPATIDEAAADVKAAKDQAKEYEEYLQERNKIGKGLAAYAKFRRNGKLYSNPLYSRREIDKIYEGLNARPSASSYGPNGPRPMPVPTPSAANEDLAKGEGEVADKDVNPSSFASPTPTVEAFLRGIASAETGQVTPDKGLLDKSRFIRTKAGSNSSAYGTFQITKSLAESSLNQGAFDDAPELKKWVADKFIPQGDRFLNSSYGHRKYGSGGAGELTSLEDRKMYLEMARILGKRTLDANRGDVLKAVGEWRFGRSKRHLLLSDDPAYAEKVIDQLHQDKMALAQDPAEIQPQVNPKTQIALNDLSKDYEASKMQPVVVPVPVPAPAAQGPEMASGGVSGRSVGASPNGASESSLMIAIRNSVSPLS